MISSSLKPTFENTLYFGFFVAAGALVVGGRKTLGKLPAGAISAGILAGTASAVSYKFSPIAAKRETFLKGEEHAIGNRAVVMAVSTFALTLLGIRYANSKLGSHTLSRSGALGYASIASITSIFGVAIADSEYREENDFFKYGKRAYKYLTTPAHVRPLINGTEVDAFWSDMREGDTTPAEWIADQYELDYADARSIQEVADRIEGYKDGDHIVEIFEGLIKEEIDSFKLAEIFMLISEEKQEASLGKLDTEFNEIVNFMKGKSPWSLPSLRHFETKHMGLDDALAAGICAGIATTVLTATPYFALATLRSAVHSPLFNRPLTAALSVATIGAFAVHEMKKDKYELSTAKKLLLSSTAMLAAGTLLTPIISRFTLKNRISYKAAFGYSLPAALLNLAVEWRREENNW